MTDSGITIIIPTAGRARRSDSLFRTIDSVLSQSGVKVTVLVVLNGTGYEPDVRKRLESRSDIQLIYQERGSYAEARHRGLGLVTSRYFGYIDDDDYFLPGALKERLDVLEADPQCGLVVSNGYYQSAAGRRDYIENFPGGDDDPCEQLFKRNWLASSGGLFRSGTVTADFFDPAVEYFEWTFTAFRITQAEIRIRFLDRPHMVITDTVGALSKSLSYFKSQPKLWEKLKRENRKASLRGPIQQKLMRSHHRLAEKYLVRGNRRLSWMHHLKSMQTFYGLRYLPYSRHLIRIKPVKRET